MQMLDMLWTQTLANGPGSVAMRVAVDWPGKLGGRIVMNNLDTLVSRKVAS